MGEAPRDRGGEPPISPGNLPRTPAAGHTDAQHHTARRGRRVEPRATCAARQTQAAVHLGPPPRRRPRGPRLTSKVGREAGARGSLTSLQEPAGPSGRGAMDLEPTAGAQCSRNAAYGLSLASVLPGDSALATRVSWGQTVQSGGAGVQGCETEPCLLSPPICNLSAPDSQSAHVALTLKRKKLDYGDNRQVGRYVGANSSGGYSGQRRDRTPTAAPSGAVGQGHLAPRTSRALGVGSPFSCGTLGAPRPHPCRTAIPTFCAGSHCRTKTRAPAAPGMAPRPLPAGDGADVGPWLGRGLRASVRTGGPSQGRGGRVAPELGREPAPPSTRGLAATWSKRVRGCRGATVCPAGGGVLADESVLRKGGWMDCR